MKTVRAIVVGAGWCLDAKIDGDKTVGELKAKLRDSRKHYMCMIDDMNLYLAKRDGKWLQWSHREVQRLLKGEVPGSVTALMPEDNKLAPECSLRDFGFTDLEHRKLEEIAVLLEYPECITRRYRRELGHSPGDAMDNWVQDLTCGVSETLVATYKWLGSLFNAMRVSVTRPKTI